MRLFKKKPKLITPGDVGVIDTLNRMMELGLLKKSDIEYTKRLLADEMNSKLLNK